MTDQTLLTQIQRAVIETPDGGLTWPSGLWSAAEVLGYLNQVQAQFIKETSLLTGRALINPVLAQEQDLPDDCLAVVAITWRTAGGVYSMLEKVDSWQLDAAAADWPTSTTAYGGVPYCYTDTEAPHLKFYSYPIPTTTAARFQVTYITSPVVLDGTGQDQLTVPDEFSPALKWGVIAEMLRKVGRAQDLNRAALAKERYDEWIEITKLLLEGGEENG